MKVKTDSQKRGGKSVLIVEDNAVIRRMIADAFLSDGFIRCGEAENGREGIELAKNFRPDLITLDLSMPDLNGLDVALELRKFLPNTPLILFTLYHSRVLETVAADAGINLVIPKTVSLSTLVEKAHNLTGD